MYIKVISTDKAPAAIGPYSQATIAGDTVYASGQLGLNPETGSLEDGIEAQTRQALTNLASVLEAAGSSLEGVLKTTIYLADIADFAAVNEIYGSFFTGEAPARACVQVANLPKGGLVEIDAVALI